MLESIVACDDLLSIVSVAARFRPVVLRYFFFGTVVFLHGSMPAIGLPQAQHESTAISKPTVPLTPSERREFQLKPNQRETFLLDIEARAHHAISFEQCQEMLRVIWSSAGQTRHVVQKNDTRINSAIRVSIVSGERAQQSFEIS